MKIIVLGAGAIGSLYGVKLSKLYDVTLVARQKHADEINKNGLKISPSEKAILYTSLAILSLDEVYIIVKPKLVDSQ